MNKPRMTVEQLVLAVNEEQNIYLKSMIDVHDEVRTKLTRYIQAIPAVMTMEVYKLTYTTEQGFIAEVGLPSDILKAIEKNNWE